MAAAPEPARTRPVVTVIDGNSIMHRAFHAIPPQMSAPDGRPTNALFGFVSMFLKMVEEFSPDGVICAFDKGKPERRLELSPEYKAQRPPTDPLLKAQFPLIRDVVAAMGVPVMEAAGWEGDDILGTLARQGEAAGCDVLLVTGDRDAYQLATEHVRIVSTKKGLSDVVIFGPEEVAALYDGVTPAQIPDFYGLKGDTSDNIPGVPGIGPKKASALVVQYGSLDAVLAHADELKGKMGENVRTHADDALLSRRLATIETTAPVTFDLEAAAWPAFDQARLEETFSSLGFTTLLRRVLAQAGAARGQGGPGADGACEACTPNVPEEPVEGEGALEELRAAVEAGAWLGVVRDDGTASGTLFGSEARVYVALSSGWEVEALAPDAAGAPGAPLTPGGRPAERPARVLAFAGDEATGALALAYGRGRVATFGAKADLHVLAPADSSLPALLAPSDVDPARVFDVSVAAYLLDSGRSDFTPAGLVASYLPFALPEAQVPERRGRKSAAVEPPDEAFRDRTCCLAAASALALRDVLGGMLEADGSASCFEDIEMPLVGTLVALERNGMVVSPSRLRELSERLGGDIDAIRARVFSEAGEEFNLDSPRQLSSVLFEKMGLPTKGVKKSKSTGAYTTNAKVLEKLAEDYPVVADVLEYREKAKIKSTYLDALPELVAGDGRVHTSYNQTVTATGRLSSSDPNLQNIPVRTELGRMVRGAFVPADPENSVILGCDYSQIELRLLAHLSGDEGLIEAFTEGEDFHAETAARVFGVPVSEVTHEMRSRAKAVNFGIVYGQTEYGLAKSLGISNLEAQGMIASYYDKFPQVRAYLDSLVAFAHENGWVETMYGRKRHVPDVFSPNKNVAQAAERTAMNHPMQGTAADIIKIAMTRVQTRLVREGFSAKMIVQVHDELDFDCPKAEVEALSAMVCEEMAGVASLRVPLLVSVETGPTWAEAH